jgi:alpha-tubulin suppressor-like RCC1 family protein
MSRTPLPSLGVLMGLLALFQSHETLWASGAVVGWGDNVSGQSSPPTNIYSTTMLSAAHYHALALTSEGAVVGWGDNASGQISVPVGATNLVGVAAGPTYSLGWRADGTVIGWGSMSNLPAGLKEVAALSAGAAGALALLRDGNVVNFDGQTVTPVGVSNATAISAGETFHLALRGDGTVAAWGDNGWGQLNVPAGLTGVVAVAAGGWHGLALKADGTVAVWGAVNVGQGMIPPGLTNVVAIAAGGWHNLALKADRSVVGWGGDWKAQATAPPLSNVVEIAAAYEYSLAGLSYGPPIFHQHPVSQLGYSGGQCQLTATASGEWPISYQWWHEGRPLGGATQATLILSGLAAADAGSYWVGASNSLGTALSSNALVAVEDAAPIILVQTRSSVVEPGGTARFVVRTTGSLPQTFQWQAEQNDLPGETNDSLTLSGVRLHQAGWYRVIVSNAFGVTSSSNMLLEVKQSLAWSVVAWGDNGAGQTNVPGWLTDAVAVSGGQNHSLALRNNGQVVAWGAMVEVPPGLTNVIAVGAGVSHNLALAANGEVVAWGDNGWGQLDRPAGLAGVTAVAAGGWHNLALKADGTVAAWGANNAGQATSPPGLSNVVAVAAGGWHSLALLQSGAVLAWGQNDFGQAVVPAGLKNAAGIACGVSHNLAIRGDGTVIAWGRNDEGQCTVPPDLSRVVAVAAGHTHSLALCQDGSVMIWGRYHGSLPKLDGAFAIGAGWAHSLVVTRQGIAILLDGRLVNSELYSARGPSVEVQLINPFGDTTMFYTLDGSDPAQQGYLYDEPFLLKQESQLLAFAYSRDFLQWTYSPPLRIAMLPALQATTDGGGTVAVYPPHGAYLSNDLAILTALPREGWQFLEWRGDATGTNPTVSITMKQDKTVRAVFGTRLDTLAAGGGAVAVSPQAPWYPWGTEMRLTAVPHPGNYFAYWGAAASGAQNPLRFVVTNAGPTVAAVFATLGSSQYCSLAVVSEGLGEATVTPSLNRYPLNSPIVVRAVPEPGQLFLGWSGAATGFNNPLTITLKSNEVIRAAFSQRPHLTGESLGDSSGQDRFRLTLTSEWGVPYRIDWTTNLIQWHTLTTGINQFGTAEYTDTIVTDANHRLYRATQ